MADRCKPGDMAVVIYAQNEVNLGRIVKVLKLHHCTGPLAMVRDCAVWVAECPTPMTWTAGPKVYQMHRGPIPDTQLQPISSRPARTTKRRAKVLEAA